MLFHLNQKNSIGMNYLFNLIVFFAVISFQACSQNTQKESENNSYNWQLLAKGLEFCEVNAPTKSILGDSKLTLVRITPSYFDFHLYTATEHNKTKYTVDQLCDSLQLNIAINAGMYDLANGLINRGFMKNFNHLNNPEVTPNYNALIAFNPTQDKKLYPFKIIDLECENWSAVKDDYHCFAQGMRMIDCNGNPMNWSKKKQACSMLLASTDIQHRIYFVFTRSPYTHNEMIGFLKAMPFELVNTIYLEGGPETSLYVKVGDTVIEKVGSYVSQTYPNDDNVCYWKLPNIIGLKLKH